MPETTPLIKAALNLRGGAGFDVYEITYDKEPYYKEFTDIILDCSDNEKKYIMQAARYAKQLIHDIKS